MRICKIWDSEYPWDVRAEKVSLALTNAGHEVHMVARNRSLRPEVELLPECTVHRLAPLPVLGAIPRIGRALNNASMFPAFFNPRWINAIGEVARGTRADIILCRDLPLVPAAVRVGRRLGLPVVLDMAENYPAMIKGIWDSGRQRLSDWAVRNPSLVEKVENWAVRNVDHIIVVVEESGERLIELGVPSDRITVVGNTPPAARAGAEAAPAPRGGDAGEVELIYLGLLEAPRGIGALIDAVEICRNRGVDIRLTLIGEGRDRADFEARAGAFDPQRKAVRFRGFIPNAEALRMLRAADIGIIPHHADESWNSTIPNKLFDYMAAGIAVVASDARPVKRVVEETGCGRVFRDRDSAHLAQTLLSLRDPERRGQCVVAGQRAIREKYNWEKDTERLLSLIQSFDAQPRPTLALAGS
jgi:glycosyltransferase involved in cell wall biosynthesis